MVVVVSRRAESADTTDADVWGLANTLLGHLTEVFVEAFAGNSAAGLSELVISLSSQAARASTLNQVVSTGTDTSGAVMVVDLVGRALDSALTGIDVIELTVRALGAEVVDKEEARLADAPVSDPVLVVVALGYTLTFAALSSDLVIAFNAVAAA